MLCSVTSPTRPTRAAAVRRRLGRAALGAAVLAVGLSGTAAGAALSPAAVAPATPAGEASDVEPAPAPDAQDAEATTDRFIVRYRTNPPAGAAGDEVRAERSELVEETAEEVAGDDGGAGDGGTADGAAADGDAGAVEDVDAERVRDMAGGGQVWTLGAELPVDQVADVAAAVVAADPAVEYAEPDRVLLPLAAAPDDPGWADQWPLQDANVGIGVLGAWDVTRGAGVNVAVIDTGYRPHADLAANIIAGYDMITNATMANDGGGRDADPSDPGDWTNANECGSNRASSSGWHGTHVAGTIAAVTGNGAGVAGIAPEAKVQPVRVLGRCGGYTSDIADAIVWASGGSVSGVPANPNPSRVINMSLGGSGACDATSQRAITTARDNGTVVVVAAGNGSTDVSTSSPANCSGVVAVASYGPSGARAYYSNYGSLVDLAGPGGDQSGSTENGVLSTVNDGATTPGSDAYAYYQGTSMASPHVAAVAALMLSANPALTPDEVESLLKSSARPFVASCSGCGAGMLDADAAVHAAAGGDGGDGGDDGGDGGDTPTPSMTEAEPNDTFAAADAVAGPTTISGAMGSRTDTDLFAIPVAAGVTVTVALTPGTTSDYDLYVYDEAGTLATSATADRGVVDTVAVKNVGESPTTVYARVVYYSGGTGRTAGAYSLGVAW